VQAKAGAAAAVLITVTRGAVRCSLSLVGCMLVSLMLMRIVGVAAHCCYEDVATTCSSAVPCHVGWMCMIVSLDNFSSIRALI
jgi:hypothetical protein